MVNERDSVSEFIDRYGGIATLFNSEYLGTALAPHAERMETDFVQKVLDKLKWGDSDHVLEAMIKVIPERSLENLAKDKNGKIMLLKFYDELTKSKEIEKIQQAKRILMSISSLIPESKLIEEFQKKVPTFPYRPQGYTVYDDAIVNTKILNDGRILVKMPTRVKGTSMFQKDVDTLDPNVFVDGVIYPPEKIIAVRRHDQGERIEKMPAMYLLNITNQGNSITEEKIEDLIIFMVSNFAGPAAVISSETTLGKEMMQMVDKFTKGVEIGGIIIKEHRGDIIEKYGYLGEGFVEDYENLESLIKIYGLGKGLVGLEPFISKLGESSKKLQGAYKIKDGEDLKLLELLNSSKEIVDGLNTLPKLIPKPVDKKIPLAPHVRLLESLPEGFTDFGKKTIETLLDTSTQPAPEVPEGLKDQELLNYYYRLIDDTFFQEEHVEGREEEISHKKREEGSISPELSKILAGFEEQRSFIHDASTSIIQQKKINEEIHWQAKRELDALFTIKKHVDSGMIPHSPGLNDQIENTRKHIEQTRQEAEKSIIHIRKAEEAVSRARVEFKPYWQRNLAGPYSQDNTLKMARDLNESSAKFAIAKKTLGDLKPSYYVRSSFSPPDAVDMWKSTYNDQPLKSFRYQIRFGKDGRTWMDTLEKY